MKTSIVDLKNKTKDILKALERNESVTLLYRGKVSGVITPAKEVMVKKVKDHQFFVMTSGFENNVLEELANMRKPRHSL
jgi:hypothetical protein